MKNYELISKSAIYVFVGVMFSRLLGYLYRVFIARVDVEMYGLYNLGLFLVQLVIPVALIGLGTGISHFIGHYKGKNDKDKENISITTSIFVVLLLSLALFLLFYFGDNLIAQLFNKPGLAIFVRYFSFLIPILALTSLFSSILKSNNKVFYMVLFASIIQSVLEIILIYLLFKTGFAEKAIILSVLIPSIISLIGILYFSMKEFSFNASGFDKGLIVYSLPLFPITFTFSFITIIDSLILGYFSSSADVAFYNAALPTAQIILIFSSALLAVFLPLISKKNAEGKTINKEYEFVMRGILFCTLPLLVISVLFNQRIISILFGGPYLIGATAFSILTLAYFIYGLSQPASNVLTMLKHQNKLLIVTILSLFVNVVLNLLLIPYSISKFGNGTIGASVATFISFTLLAILLFSMTYKYGKIKIFGKGIEKIVLASFISLIIVYLFRKIIGSISLTAFFAYLILYLGLYLLILYKIKFFDKTDKELIRSLFIR